MPSHVLLAKQANSTVCLHGIWRGPSAPITHLKVAVCVAVVQQVVGGLAESADQAHQLGPVHGDSVLHIHPLHLEAQGRQRTHWLEGRHAEGCRWHLGRGSVEEDVEVKS